jgi:hypothetical protein
MNLYREIFQTTLRLIYMLSVVFLVTSLIRIALNLTTAVSELSTIIMSLFIQLNAIFYFLMKRGENGGAKK